MNPSPNSLCASHFTWSFFPFCIAVDMVQSLVKWRNQVVRLSASLILFCCFANSTTLSMTGMFDPANANDVAFIQFALATPGSVNIQTWGYGGTANAPGGTNGAGTVIPAGGFDPYISLFQGWTSAATFVESNDDGACPPGEASPACHDSTLNIASLTAGQYTLALTVFDNFSFAENFGSGTLGDGFIGLGNYFDADSGTVRNSKWAVDVVGPTITPESGSNTPEPGSILLMAVGSTLVFLGRRRMLRGGSR